MDIDIELQCPECTGKFKVTVGEISRGLTKTCPSGHRVQLIDDGGGAREATRALDEFDRELRRFGR